MLAPNQQMRFIQELRNSLSMLRIHIIEFHQTNDIKNITVSLWDDNGLLCRCGFTLICQVKFVTNNTLQSVKLGIKTRGRS